MGLFVMMNPLDHPSCFATPLRVTESGWLEHVPFGMIIVDLARPKVLVELGTHTGVSYCAFCQAVSSLELDTTCYAIDTWQGDPHAGEYGPEVLQDLRAHHDPRYNGFSRLVQSTFDDALAQFPDHSIDLLHIDGCHSYDSVKHDFESWLPKLTNRAIVLMHDTNVRERQFGVWKLWEELRARYPHREFTHGNGLGLLVIDQYPTEAARQLVEVTNAEWPTLRQFFYQLGSRLSVQHALNQNINWLTNELTLKEQHVRNLQEANMQHEKVINDLLEKTAKQAEQVAAFSERTGQLDREVQRSNSQLANRVRAVEVLTGQVRDKDTHIRNLDGFIADREARLRELGSIASDREQLARRLYNIEARASWQLLNRLWQVQMRVAAPSTAQGKAWLAITKGARRLLPRRLINPLPASIASGTSGFSTAAPASETTPEQNERYVEWLQRNEPSATELHAQRTKGLRFTYQPLLSIVTPVYDPPVEILRATIASVQAQTYAKWELCVVDGGSTDPSIRTLLNQVAAQDSRIHVTYLKENLGISGNSNAAAALTTGEFIVLLDHDDTLAPNTLFEVTQALNQHPNTDILYFDEDKISEDGKERSEPFFKPDWSPEMLLSANYLMHSVVRRELFMEVGGFTEGTEGAQDWDLMLRCTEQTSAIVHIPKILYHWRQMIGSTAATYEAKPYVFDNQLRIVKEHLQRQGIAEAQTRFTSPGSLQALWPTHGSIVSIIIPTKEKVELLRPCLSSLLRLTTYKNFEVILVDNGSQKPNTLAYYEELRHDARVRILDYPHPFNYSAANNFGATHATGEILLFLNNDIEILDPDWLEDLVRWSERPDIGAVGAKLLYPDGHIQHAGVIIGMEGHASHVFWGVREQYNGVFGSTEWYRDYSAVTGACLMMRRTLFEEIGRFDENYELAFSDIEICLRAVEAGYRNVYTPFARLRHHEGGSRGQHIPVDDILRGYEHMHVKVEKGDPYFNLNLSYAHRIPHLSTYDEESRIARLKRLCGI